MSDLHDLRRRLPGGAILPECGFDGLESGDYWRIGESSDSGNLTGLSYGFYFDGFGLFRLTKHTIREHEDGTISIVPGDGSSNSVRVSGNHDSIAHGYFRRNRWEAA